MRGPSSSTCARRSSPGDHDAALRASPLDWVSVRLPNIVAGPDKPIRVSADGRGIGLSITAESVARFLLAQVASAEHLRSAPSISH